MAMKVAGRAGVPLTPGGPRVQPGRLIVQAIMIDGHATKLVEEGHIDSIKLRFPEPDREAEIIIWTPEGRKALAFQ